MDLTLGLQRLIKPTNKMIDTSFSDLDPSPRDEIKRKHSNSHRQHNDLNADEQERSVADAHRDRRDASHLYFI